MTASQEPLTTDPLIAACARRKVYGNIVLPAFLVSVMAYLDRNNLSYAILTMKDDLRFSDAVFGFGASIFFIGYFLFEVPGAIIAEKTSARLWLARIMISWGLLTGLMALVNSVWHFYLVRFLIGAAEASLYPVLYASVIPRWFAPRDRARAIAIMLCSLQLSAIIGGPLAGWLIDTPMFGWKGWQALFILEAIPAVLLGLVLVYWMADSPQTAWWLTRAEANYLEAQANSTEPQLSEPQSSEPDHSHRPQNLLQAVKDRQVLTLCLTYFLWMTGYWGFNYYTPSILKGFGWSHPTVGWMMALAMSMSLVVMLFIGHNSSRTGEKRWHGACGMFLGALGMVGGSTIEQPLVAYGFLCLAGIGVYAALGVWWSYPTTFLKGTAAAGTVGLINSLGSLGGFVGPYLTGWAKQVTGSYSAAWILLAASLVAAGLLILSLKTSRNAA